MEGVKEWGEGGRTEEQKDFPSFPSPTQSSFFWLSPHFLRRPNPETLATQAKEKRTLHTLYLVPVM